jgi:hypothetical protein
MNKTKKVENNAKPEPVYDGFQSRAFLDDDEWGEKDNCGTEYIRTEVGKVAPEEYGGVYGSLKLHDGDATATLFFEAYNTGDVNRLKDRVNALYAEVKVFRERMEKAADAYVVMKKTQGEA